MSIINRFLTVVTEPEFKLARDLTAMAIADGELTPDEKEAISAICHIEGIDQRKLLENLTGKGEQVAEEMPQTRRSKEEYLRNLIKLIGADSHAAPQEVYLFQIIAGRQARATETFCQNEILMKGFKRAGLDLARILKEEELRVFMKYTG